MTLLIADIETDGLLRAKDDRPEMTKIHCICTKNPATGEVAAYWDNPDDPFEEGNFPNVKWAGTVARGAEDLAAADFVVFHNGQGFDIPTIKKFTGVNLWKETKVRDTQSYARLIFPRVGDLDRVWEKKHRRRVPKMREGKTMFGSHALEAWGHRLKVPKADAPEDFLELTEEMVLYCIRDLETTEAIWKYLLTFKWPARSVALEHPFARHIEGQIHRGVGFLKDEAMAFLGDLEKSLAMIEVRIQELLGPWVTFTPKKRIRKERPVNLKSPLEVTRTLKKKFGLVWPKLTPSGLPAFDADSIAEILGAADIPIKDDLLEWSDIKAAITRLTGGPQAKKKGGGLITNAVDHGDHWRIHGYVNHNGARNGRCSHSRPNMNLPKAGTPFAEEFRSLIVPRPDYLMVGCDMVSADLRIIAHEVYPHDGGKMVKKVLEGKIHEWNLENLMVPHHATADRDDAKNTVYAVAYGARKKKIASMHGIPMKTGALILDAFNGAYEGLGAVSGIEQDIFEERGFVTLLDGRRILPDIPYKAFNYKVAGNMAIVFKRATIVAHEKLEDLIEAGLTGMVLHVHDEFEWEAHPDHAEYVGQTLVESIAQAAVDLKVRCPMTGEYKIGANWWEVH